jgi:hypothetical protein
MEMDHVGMQLFEDVEETSRGGCQVPAHVRLHGESFRPHPLAERAKSRHRIDAGVVALFSLQPAHLRDERLSAADFHAVNHVRYFHSGCLNLRQYGFVLYSGVDLDELFEVCINAGC